ncbi:TrbM/KikA/MpfK family conjugal transfer protein [Neisseria sp. Ec49-e6-T10]|uniref:TrbM/KikA/MpfK family conjugal transfer protein n=1 Tax=Neisseria sp. Ec49-e6-T10 TaxID=3140744 RepID=UPI003EBAA24F
MKFKLFSFFMGLALFLTSTLSFAEEDILTGDTRLSCEAILCLSSGEKPSECAPSLKRYFTIHKKKMSDTIKARKDFLSICPSSKEEGMPSLISAISKGAGRCDADELNRVNRKLVKVPNPEYQQCVSGKRISRSSSCASIPSVISKYIIQNARPSYCTAYFNHGWTYNVDSVKYIGDPYNGGKWVNQ